MEENGSDAVDDVSGKVLDVRTALQMEVHA
jgi:hypothetical protein